MYWAAIGRHSFWHWVSGLEVGLVVGPRVPPPKWTNEESTLSGCLTVIGWVVWGVRWGRLDHVQVLQGV